MTASKLLVKREGDFHYPICFEEDFSNLAQVMKEEGLVDRKICIVTDSNVGPLYEESVKQVLSEVSSDISVFTFEYSTCKLLISASNLVITFTQISCFFVSEQSA